MKIFVIDAVDLFNDIMFEFMSLNRDMFKQIDNRILYTGNYIKYNDIKTTLALCLDSLQTYIAIHFVVAREPPKFLYDNVILDYKHIYEYLVKAITSLSKTNYMSVSMYIHEYDSDNNKTAIMSDLSTSIGTDNVDIYKLQCNRMFI